MINYTIFWPIIFWGEMPEHAQSDFISDRFLWETKDIRTTDIAYTIFITDTQILEIYIERILRDWSKGEVCVVFTNRQSSLLMCVVRHVTLRMMNL
jgi:hypothetical protein